jgi:hypothetical protein
MDGVEVMAWDAKADGIPVYEGTQVGRHFCIHMYMFWMVWRLCRETPRLTAYLCMRVLRKDVISAYVCIYIDECMYTHR